MKRPALLPLVPLYAAASAAHRAAYRLGFFKASALEHPVISVGSLSAGGAGKTPVVMMLAKLIARRGLAVDVLTRGYKRSGQAVEEVALDRPDAATCFGDEPVEMAEAGLRVIVGRDRLAAGRFAESTQTGPRLHLLDDGFQHRRLARQLDLVLFTAADAADHLLPSGDLREPLRALVRADAVLLRAEEAGALAEIVRRRTQAEIWLIQRTLTLPSETALRPYAFCGIARPQGFWTDLRAAGTTPAGEQAFRDHHLYTVADMQTLAAAARKAGADGFVTTAKDAVKLTRAMRDVLTGVGPLAVARLEVTLAADAVPLLDLALAALSR